MLGLVRNNLGFIAFSVRLDGDQFAIHIFLYDLNQTPDQLVILLPSWL